MFRLLTRREVVSLYKHAYSAPPSSPQRFARLSKYLTEMGMALSQSRSWGWPCVPWAICPMRWNWRLSSKDLTWMVRLSLSAARNPTRGLYCTVTCLYFCSFRQAMARLALKNSSHCSALNSLQLGCLISSTEQTSTRCFGRYSPSLVSSVINSSHKIFIPRF